MSAGADAQTVSFTVAVNTANGGTVENHSYTIEGTGIFPIGGAPVRTAVAQEGASVLGNISTRLRVETGDNVLIGGFIVTGTQLKKVIVRAIGRRWPLPGKLANPTLELYTVQTLLESNDNWVTSANKQAIIESTVAPKNELESAIVRTLPRTTPATPRSSGERPGGPA